MGGEPALGPLHATALIAAAGSGQRLGAGGAKAFVELAGRPLLDYSLQALAGAQRITRVVIAAPPGEELPAERLLAGHSSLTGVVLSGGATRAASVRAALAEVDSELVVVHDAARPLADPALFDAIVDRLAQHPGVAAVIAAAPIVDTVKRSVEPQADRDGAPARVAETVPRERLWAAQTPQGFRVAELRAAQDAAQAAGELDAATDEAGLIEAAGGVVLLEPGPAYNLKVTTPADLRAAEALLAAVGRV